MRWSSLCTSKVWSYCSLDCDSTLLVAANGDVGFLVDLREGRIEGLREAIVKRTGLTVMLSRDHHQRVHVIGCHVAGALRLCVVQA